LQQKSWDWEAGPVEAARPDEILLRLRAAGYEAYYVGGCVRDTLLGRPVHDWDIATAAEPARVQALFPRTVPTGLRHGTVTVLTGSGQAEVTTFRVDGDYRDGRHPASVRFVRTLREDLSRRDFTVNAMAMDEAGSLTDLFGGRDDLARRLIRCVGEPETRFREDALRMLRAYRFLRAAGL
jgi:tRNA nucleotidyltransferase (CCA-adding enzyme)